VLMRIRPSLKAAGEKAAEAEGRSLSSLLERGLILILRQLGYREEIPEPPPEGGKDDE